MNVPKKNEKGFTIIEVVLVLAIAALIFLMVFIALPALQRSQRDSQRREDLGRVQTAINQYQSNNRNSLPTFNAQFTSQYMTVGGDTFLDPAGANRSQPSDTNTYLWVSSNATLPSEFEAAQNRIYVSTRHVCDENGEVKRAGSTKVALRMKLEGGGVACVNN